MMDCSPLGVYYLGSLLVCLYRVESAIRLWCLYQSYGHMMMMMMMMMMMIISRFIRHSNDSNN